MKRRYGIFLQLLTSFGLFAAGLAIVMGCVGYFTLHHLSLELLEQRAAVFIDTLIKAEKQARNNDDLNFETDKLVASLRLEFLVGKQLPASWHELADGFHILRDGAFVYIRREQGVIYALSGNMRSQDGIFHNIGIRFILCGGAGIIAAAFLAFFLSRRFTRPIRSLAYALEKDVPASGQILPLAYCARKDETGFLAEIIRKYQISALERIERERFFTGAVSHELRTPLTVITQGLELLEARNQENARTLAILARLSRTTAEMTATTQNLLHFARGGKQKAIQLDINGIISNVLEDIYPEKHTSKNDKDSCYPKKDLVPWIDLCVAEMPENVWGQPALATMAIRNLLENAIRHRAGKKVLIKLASDNLRIRNLAKFEAAGMDSGLGLLIARQACDHMGWRLEQSGNIDETIFTIIFH